MVDRFDSLARTGKPYKACHIGPLTTVIGADARIWHCCVQRGQEFFNFGSVADRPFPEVWREVHAANKQAQIDVQSCPKCRYDGYNQIIEEGFIHDHLHGAFV
jgi:radical SAM protein with 4Fe4S-binding SPASM domain